MNASLPIVFGEIFGGWEIVLILAMALLLFGRKRLPELISGLREGLAEFRRGFHYGTQAVLDGVSQEAHDAGKSLGGIFGKPAAEAITPQNEVAELYDPAVFGEKDQLRLQAKQTILRRFSAFREMMKFFSKFLHGSPIAQSC